MNETERKVVAVAVTGAIGIGGAHYFGVLTETRLQVVGVVIAFLAAGYFGTKKQVFSRLREQNQELVEDGSLDSALSEEDARERVIDWSEDTYKGRDRIQFRFSNAKTDSTRLLWPDGERELLRYFYTAYGEDRKGVIVFIECTSGTILGHQTVTYLEQKQNPFEYSDYYQRYKEERKLQAYTESGRRRNQKQSDPFKADDGD